MSVSASSHILLSPFSRALMGVGSAMAAILDPRRGDMVAAMGETTAFTPILQNIRRRMENDIEGSRLLRDQPRVTNATVSREELAKCPEGSLGREYLKFLEGLNTSPDARPPVRYVDNPEHLYIMRRYRETHDFNHVVLQMKTNMLREVAVKYFEAIQFGLPMCVSGAVFGPARLLKKNREQFYNDILPWVVEQASNGRFFLAVQWENHFHRPLEEIQKELNITPCNQYSK